MKASKNNFVIGIDVGGTNTGSKKVLNQQNQVKASDISAIMLGTTTFVNAIVQTSDELSPVTVVRLCQPATKLFPPFCNFPKKLKDKIEQKIYFCNGGYEYNQQEITKIDKLELEKVADELIELYKQKQLSILNIVVSGIFSSLSNVQEVEAGQVFEQKFKAAQLNYSITLSNEISQIGLLEREGASILNACLIPLAQRAILGLENALLNLSFTTAQLFLTSNSGTIISSERAQQFPIFTLASGPVNSLRGAGFLTQLQNAIVCDIGGTTTDLAIIQNGFPRPCSAYVSLAGVRTNFRMTDTVSFGLGGGSLVKFENNEVRIGPQSVGYKLKSEALSFGGDVLTTTDIALSLGLAKIEGTTPSKVNVTEEQKQQVIKQVIKQIEFYVDQIKTSTEPIDLILVGGGSILIPQNAQIEGISKIIRPQYFDVANAIGAANIQVEGIADMIIQLDPSQKEQLLNKIKSKAILSAIQFGAIPNSINCDNIDQIELSYLPGYNTRIIVKAIGDLDISKVQKQEVKTAIKPMYQIQLDEKADPFIEDFSTQVDTFQSIQIQDPKIVSVNGRKEWHLSEFDADCIAIGAGILGCGGGGSPYLGNLQLKFTLRSGQIARVISPDNMRRDEFAQIIAYYGAPMIFIEKLSGGEGCKFAMQELQQQLKANGKNVQILTSAEIGGNNSIIPLIIGAEQGIPMLDGDFMGRAFPQLQMLTCLMYNIMKCCPICLSNEKNNCFTLKDINDCKQVENALRNQVVKIGCLGGIAMDAMSKDQIDKSMIKYSLSRCWRLGRQILIARKNKTNPLLAIKKQENGQLVFQGKIINVDRESGTGFTKGIMTITGINTYKNQTLQIEFQNENLIARLKYDNAQEAITLATVPDLICLVDLETFDPICTEDLKNGLRINCLIIPCDPLLKTAQALAFCGPKAFGYQVDYNPEFAGNMTERRSIIHEYN